MAELRQWNIDLFLNILCYVCFQNKVSVDEAPNYNGPKYFVITFVLCGVIAGCVLAVVALYVVRRPSRSKQKLMQLAGQGEGLEASKDYQVCVLNV